VGLGPGLLAASDCCGGANADLIALGATARGAEVDRRTGHGEVARLIPLRLAARRKRRIEAALGTILRERVRVRKQM